MKNLFLSMIILLVLVSDLLSQVNETWRKSYIQGIESRLIGFRVDPAGNIITGTSVNNFGIGQYTDFAIIKFNSSGDTLWRREYHSVGNKHDHLFDIYTDAAGNIYATGLSTGYQSTEVATLRTIKYSPSGSVLWEAIDSTNTVMAVNGESKEAYIQEGPDGDIYVCTNKLRRVYVIRYTPSGNLVWHKEIDIPSEFNNRTFPRKFAVRPEGFYIFCSALNSSFQEDVLGIKCRFDGDTLWTWTKDFMNNFHEAARGMEFDSQGNMYFLVEILQSFTTSRMAILKFGASTAFVWEEIYGSGNDRVIPTDLKIDNDYNVIAICKLTRNPPNNNRYDAITIKYNSAGDSLWTKRIKGYNSFDAIPNNVVLDNNNFVYVTGQYPMPPPFQNFCSQFFQKYSPAGDSLWNFKFENLNFWSMGWYINIDNAGNAVIASSRDQGIMLTKYGNVTAIKQISSEIPESFTLGQNYPNPFNPKTVINYELRVTDHVTFKVFDISGREVAALVNEKQNAGTYSVTFDASNLSSGTYFYRLTTGEFSETKKMILTK